MTKASVSQWSSTAADNTDIGGITLNGNVMRPRDVDNAFRELMAQVKDAIPFSTPQMFGAVGDGVADDETAVDSFFSYLSSESTAGDLGIGEYTFDSISLNPSGEMTVRGYGPHLTTLKRGADGGNFITIKNSQGGLYEGFTVDNDFDTNGDGGQGFLLENCNNQRVRGVDVIGIGNSDEVSGGSAMASWPTSTSDNVRNIVFQDMHLVGDTTAVNTVGTIIVDGRYCYQNGIFAENFTHFATEYKEDTRYSIATDIIAYNSEIALGYGQSTVGDDGCDYNVAANIVSHECQQALAIGEGDYNLFANVLAYSTADAGLDFSTNTYGVDHSTDSIGTVVANLLTVGAGIKYPVRYRGSAARCYTSVASHDTAAYIVTLDVGATKNATEILHPGARTSILTAINDVSGSASDGSAANPIWCHATGEYVGSISGRFHWKLGAADAATGWGSAQRWRLESDDNAVIGMASPGGASDNAGIQVIKGATANYAAMLYVFGTDYWSLRAGSTNLLRFANNLMRPENDNLFALGSTANRFSTVYAGTGTINTSDEREKTEIVDATEDAAAIRAVRKIRIKRFKWKDAVAEKGTGARLHFGVIAQEVVEAFASEGLNAADYGLLCYDEWAEEPEIVQDGIVVQAYRPACNRYGVRYDELLALKIAAMEG